MDYKETIDDCKEKIKNSDLSILEEVDLKNHYQIKIENIGTLRIYNGKKKTTIDYSQIPAHFKKRIMDIIQPPNKDKVLGIDESGKGDFFGPLVIASAYVEDESILRSQGIMDSKRLNDEKILRLYEIIKKSCYTNVIKISPKKYNELYEDIGNLNELLAWGHAKVIENSLHDVKPDYAVSDQFAKEDVLKSKLQKNSKNIKLIQRTKAEELTSVAAASIVARAEFVLALQKLSFEYGMELPLGAGNNVIEAGKEFVKKFGEKELKKVCKLHFSTADKIRQI